MIIDSHHHLWNYHLEEYGWMDDSMEILKRDYRPADIEPELKKAGVTGTVVVQARQSMEETRWLLDLADEHPLILGVVGWVDLCSSDLNRQLDDFAGHPKLVGVRHVVHDEPDDDFMLQPDFVRGIGALAEHNLAYDLLLFPRHLKRAAELAGVFPEQRFVLDHLGKPLIKAGIMEPWKSDLEALAALPNVWCKISGMVTEADHRAWKYEDFAPYMQVILEAFGAGRIMLGSDWPVCQLAGTYHEVMSIPLKFISRLNKSEQRRITSQNAIDCYNLKFIINEEEVQST